MRRPDLKFMIIAALLAAWFGCGAALAAEDTPWKVRRPADNTVLPSEFVHRPEAVSLSASDSESQAAKPAPGRSKAAEPSSKQPAEPLAPAPQAAASSTPATSTAATSGADASSPSPAAPKAAPQRNLARAGDLQIAATDKGVTLMLPLARKAEAPRTFTLSQPVRMVVDVPGAWDNAGANVYRLDSPWVEKVVLGEHRDFLRLVIYPGTAPDGVTLSLKAEVTPGGVRVELHPR